MIRNEQQDVVSNRHGRQPSPSDYLAEFDGERMAVVLRKAREQVVLCGTAVYVQDDDVGNSLRIELEDEESGNCVLILAENEWSGRIIPDFHYGCRFCVVIN